ncbi:hypothetical protein HK101_008892 [Irineochytrium annulatum]|nr:hypothetical protein HK101_008892 [Irineochytrium annulatum]
MSEPAPTGAVPEKPLQAPTGDSVLDVHGPDSQPEKRESASLSPADQDPAASFPTLSRARRRFCLFILCLVQFLNVYSDSSVVIALPKILSGLGADSGDGSLQWIVSAYPLTFAGTLLLMGRLTDHYGKRRFLSLGMVFLTLSSFFCALSRWVDMLIIGRALQGVGAAATIPAALGAIADLFTDPAELNVAFSMFGASSPIGFIFGLVISGVLSQTLGWESVFHVYGAITAIVTVLAYVFLPPDKPIDPNHKLNLDVIGALLSTASLVIFTFAIVSGPAQGWASVAVLVPLAVSIVGFVLFVLWERKTANPLLPRGLFTARVTMTLLVIFIVIFSFEGFAVNANLFFQNVFNDQPIITAAMLMPMVVVGFFTAATTGPLFSRFPNPRPFLLFGLTLLLLACILFSLSTSTTPYLSFPFAALCVVTLGFDVVFNVANIVLMTSVPPHHRGIAGGVFNTAIQLATGLTLAGTQTVVVSIEGQGGQAWQGYRAAFWMCAGAAVVGVLVVLGFWNGWKLEREREVTPEKEGGGGAVDGEVVVDGVVENGRKSGAEEPAGFITSV